MYAPKTHMQYTEAILTNVRDTPLKRELIDCINDLPDEILLTIRPLLHMLIENTSTIEAVSFDDLSEEEKADIAKARTEYERGETIDANDIDWGRPEGDIPRRRRAGAQN